MNKILKTPSNIQNDAGHVITLFKLLLKELRIIESSQSTVKIMTWRLSPVYRYVKEKYTDLNTSWNDIYNLETYISVLHGQRRSQELQLYYKGVGERSIEEAAAIVGLKLPKLYEDPHDK